MKARDLMSRQLTRRQLVGLGLATVAGALSTGFDFGKARESYVLMSRSRQPVYSEAVLNGRLSARPASRRLDAPASAATGLRRLDLPGEGEAFLDVSAGYRAAYPAPLLLSLHGAGGNARQSLALLQGLAAEAGFLLLAPSAQQRSWDGVRGGYSPDGASYARSLGITNGTLLGHVIAFSPGFVAPTGRAGAPRFFISHGTADRVLPIDRCSRRIVPQLQRAATSSLPAATPSRPASPATP